MSTGVELKATDAANAVRLTAVSKLKHADLWAAAKRMGGQAALARYIGVYPSEIGEWITMKRCPSKAAEANRPLMVSRLEQIVGKPFDQIFSDSVREAVLLLKGKTTREETAIVKSENIAEYAYAIESSERLKRNAISVGGADDESDGRRKAIESALSGLPERKARMIRMRFGLDGPAMTYSDIAKAYSLSVERIRAIVEDGLRRLPLYLPLDI